MQNYKYAAPMALHFFLRRLARSGRCSGGITSAGAAVAGSESHLLEQISKVRVTP